VFLIRAADGLVFRSVTGSAPVPDDGVIELLGLLAYGELTAFERLATDARMAPTLADKMALASMAAAEFDHFTSARDHLVSLGADPEGAMAPFVSVLNHFHNLTAPADWLESLVKAYVGDGIASDFYREIAAVLEPATRKIVYQVLGDTGHAAFAVERVRAAIDADPVVAGRLALWARRLMGEALTQAQRVAVDHDALARMLSDMGDLEMLAEMFHRITRAHADRMSALGLSA
jgi:tRNA-(MS[2]IO[6]A)-hydroxylase (MiaE)-like